MFRTILVLSTIVFWAGTACAVEPILWRDDTLEAFAKGEPDGVSLTRDGWVVLAPDLQEVADTGDQFVWALAADRRGRLFIGTGNSGKIYVLKKGGHPDLLFDSPEVAIFSLAVDPDGTLYAGSSPNGLIYRIAPGKDPAVLCRTGDSHVWGLVPDGRRGLYAATGGNAGRILRISSKGTVDEIYRTPDHNVVSLTKGPDGILYSGTDENGLVHVVRPDGEVGVLYDAPEKEIHTLALGPDGILFAGAMSGSARRERGNAAPQGQAEQVAPPKARESSVIYTIRPSGAAFRIWETDEPMLLALSVDPQGEITAVAGELGKVYRIRQDGTATLVSRMADVQPWSFSTSPNGGIWIGSAGSGKVYRLGKALSREGTLTSEPRDFGLVSRWGMLAHKVSLPPRTSVSFGTRSGNSEIPDDTWSPWSDPLTGGAGIQIPSPPGRFLQYRMHLATGNGRVTPRVWEVTLSGLQENVRPLIHSLSVTPPNGPEGGGGGRSTSGQNGNQARQAADGRRSIWRINWSAGDANNDDLVYALHFLGRGEKQWKLLEEDLTDNTYPWNTESAPEGTMQVRVVASDRPSNPGSQALSAERISAPFEIDHSPPSVRLTALGQTGARHAVTVEGTVDDATSPIREAAYAVNSGPWNVVFPVDRIFDSRSEVLRFTIEDLAPGECTVVVRAIDALGNVGVARGVVVVE